MPSCRFRGWCTFKSLGGVLFEKYLLYTNLTLSVVFTSVADFTEQKAIRYVRDEHNVNWDKNRTARVTAIGGVCGGIASHYWFHFLELRLPGRTFKTIMKKVWLDQLIFSPVYNVLLFITLDIMEKLTYEQIKTEVKDKAVFLVLAEILTMPPLQAINFYFVKPNFRVMYDYVLSVIISGFTSYVKYDFSGISHLTHSIK